MIGLRSATRRSLTLGAGFALAIMQGLPAHVPARGDASTVETGVTGERDRVAEKELRPDGSILQDGSDPSARTMPGLRPHVLLVTVDTLRADRLSAYGYGRPTSPNIDDLMARGVRFEQARTIEPLTTPALASLLTSLDPHVHGSTRNGLRIHDGLDSLPKALARSGWDTAAFVSNWTLRDRLSNLGGHFDHFEEVFTRKRWFGLFSAEANATDVTDRVSDWIVNRVSEPSSRPFFLWAHYVEPHAPYTRQDAYVEPLALSRRGGLTKSERYDTEIAFVDAEIGRLIDTVREVVPLSQLLVVFTADHGESLGEHGHWGHGRHLYESALHVPMSVTWHGRLEPRVVDAPALVTDVPRTVLGLVGASQPEGFGGFDWTSVFDGSAGAPEDRVTFYQSHKGAVAPRIAPNRRARTSGLLRVARIENDRKVIVRTNGSARQLIFDLRSDPAEQSNLAAGVPAPPRAPKSLSNAERIASLQAWLGRVREGLVYADQVLSADVAEQDAEKLRALGYLD